MDEARAVIARLNRIDLLKAELLDELRELVREAEVWARIEGDERAEAAAAALKDGYGGRTVASPLICR
jgi:hypothetical protein